MCGWYTSILNLVVYPFKPGFSEAIAFKVYNFKYCAESVSSA